MIFKGESFPWLWGIEKIVLFPSVLIARLC